MKPAGPDQARVPRVLISPRVLLRLRLYIDLCPFEVGGLGTVVPLGEDLLVSDIFLIRQRATDSDTELDPQAVAEHLLRTVQDGKDPATIRLWWHSHADGDLGWSDTDERTIARLRIEQLVSIVGNKRDQFWCRLDYFSPKRLTADRLPLIPLQEGSPADDQSLRRQVMAELREKVTLLHREYSVVPEIFFDSSTTLEIPVPFDEPEPPHQG